MSTLSSRNNQQEIYKDLPSSYDESQALAGVPVVKQIEMITEEIIAFSEEKNMNMNSERLKNQEKTHKREREERERNYKYETDLMQQTIDHLEQTIRTLQT
ncbi:6334_t:CDS:2 [Cetraspora pellucida]|uniref:6334_t:CDS:1 n=1 Tax=Cetraspora pellucida TaxID=1433469 RepID=A0A9N9HPV1_9GLOM|nr:6334_t:CDS:2 [Cetraspora pellucida]